MQIKPVSRLSPSDRHELTLLNPKILANHARFSAKGKWHGRFHVAAWVRFPEGLMENVELMLSYRDGERRKSYWVDRCLANRQTLILLNGSVDLDIKGEVEEMSLYLKGPSENAVWILDECHLKPSMEAQASIPKQKSSTRVR